MKEKWYNESIIDTMIEKRWLLLVYYWNEEMIFCQYKYLWSENDIIQ